MNDAPFPITPEHYLSLWYDALRCELGLIIPISSPSDAIAIMNYLYTAKKDINDPRLAGLSIHVPEDSSAIYIYKKEVDLDD